jgi:hypothetical protein
MVEVFKTNITDKTIADEVIHELQMVFPKGLINFDLDDCDNILRIENENVIPDFVSEVLMRKGFICEVLE